MRERNDAAYTREVPSYGSWRYVLARVAAETRTTHEIPHQGTPGNARSSAEGGPTGQRLDRGYRVVIKLTFYLGAAAR